MSLFIHRYIRHIATHAHTAACNFNIKNRACHTTIIRFLKSSLPLSAIARPSYIRAPTPSCTLHQAFRQNPHLLLCPSALYLSHHAKKKKKQMSSSSATGSDFSFTSVHSSFTSSPTKSSPSPPHVSTSTISHSSHTSIIHEASPSTRIPKARVFVARSPSPSRSPRHCPRCPTSPPRPPRTSRPHHHSPRCISDFIAMNSPSLTPDAVNYLAQDPQLPSWLPKDELRDWQPSSCEPHLSHTSLIQDPCVESRWVSSLRNLGNLYRLRERELPELRGSVLDVKPPSLAERLGLPQRRTRERATGLDRVAERAMDVKTERRRAMHATGDAGVAIVEAAAFGCEGRGDDYVGFLGGDVRIRDASRVRKRWRRWLRRLM